VNFDESMRMAELGVALVRAVVWPLVILVFLIRFHKPIFAFLSNLTNLKGSVGPVNISLERQVQAAVSLAAAETSKPDAQTAPADIERSMRQITDTIIHAPQSERGSSILWVDDIPSNNRFERESLEAFGFTVSISTSTDDAIDKVRDRRYDVIISDMGRPPDNQAGYTLLKKLRDDGIGTPYIIYAGSNRPEHQQLARERGAIGSTNSPRELFNLVTQAAASRTSP
jgi:CheY-like chemotaxis protein